jgi:rRNA-processing protein EBP2
MVTKSKLKMALAAEKGIDFSKLKQQKKSKEAAKRKASKEQNGEDESDLENGGEEVDEEKVGIRIRPKSQSFSY